MKITSVIFYTLLISLIFIIGCGGDEEDIADLDTSPPEVRDVIVAGSTSAAATNGPIVVVFSEAVEPASVQAAITLTPQVDGAAFYDEDTRTLTFDPEPDLQAHTTYSVTVSGISDAAGNEMELYTFFTLLSE